MTSRPGPPPAFRCFVCSEEVPELELLWDDCGVLATWAGFTWACCFLCSEFYPNENMFLEEAEARRRKHYARGGGSWGCRNERCRMALCVAEELFSSDAQWQLRQLTLQRREAAAMALAMALDTSEMCCPAAEDIVSQYFRGIWGAPWGSESNYPESQRIKTAFIARETAKLRAVFEGVTISFVCKSRSCGQEATQDKWISEGNDFKCPTCHSSSRPEDAGMAISMTDPLSGFVFHHPCEWPATLARTQPEAFQKHGTFLNNGWLNHLARSSNIGRVGMLDTGEGPEAVVQKSVVSLSDFLVETWGIEPRLFDWTTFVVRLADILAGTQALCSSPIMSSTFGLRLRGP